MKLHNVLINYSSLTFYHFLKSIGTYGRDFMSSLLLVCSERHSWGVKVAGARRIEFKKKTCLPITFSTTGKTKIFFKYHVICSRKKCKALNFIMRGNLRVRPAGVMSAPPSPKRPRTDTEQELSIVTVCACQSLNSASQRLNSASKFRLDCKFSWLCAEI